MATIHKSAWIYIKDRKVLYARSKDKDVFYKPGGKREVGESDEQALVREIKEELQVDLVPESIRYIKTFTDQAHGKPAGVIVEVKCYEADFTGELKVGAEIAELGWLTSKDIEKTSNTGQMCLRWLKERDLID